MQLTVVQRQTWYFWVSLTPVGIPKALEVQAEFHYRSAVVMGPLVNKDLSWELWLGVGEL